MCGLILEIVLLLPAPGSRFPLDRLGALSYVEGLAPAHEFPMEHIHSRPGPCPDPRGSALFSGTRGCKEICGESTGTEAIHTEVLRSHRYRRWSYSGGPVPIVGVKILF